MYTPNKIVNLRRAAEALLTQANHAIARSDYVKAEQLCRDALKQWRHGGGPNSEEHRLAGTLGKCLEAQQKYEQAYELYMEVLPNLKGSAYDDLYSSLLYLNERMGTFRKKADDEKQFNNNKDDQGFDNPWY